MQFNSLLAVLATSARTVLVQIKIIFRIKQNKYKTNNTLVNKKNCNKKVTKTFIIWCGECAPTRVWLVGRPFVSYGC